MSSLRLYTLLLALSLAGCELINIGTGSGETTEPILPLAVGNTWVLQSTLDLFERPDPEVSMDTIRVTADTLIDGEVWYRVVDRGLGFDFYAANRADGLWKWTRPSDPNFRPYLALRYPATPGDTYAPQENERVRVVAIDTTVTVEAGTFAATHYELGTERIETADSAYANAFTSAYYYAPGTGFVKQELTYVSVRDEAVVNVGEQVRTLVAATLE